MVIFGFLHALFCAQYNSTSYTIDAICMATVHSSDNIGDQYTMKTHTPVAVEKCSQNPLM